MKMKKLLGLAMVLGLVLLTGVAFAADTNTLTVQASVLGTCKFVAPKTSTLDFGSLDPSVGNNVNASTTTQFWCTKGVTTDVVSAGNGSHYSGGTRNMLDAVSTDLIPYTLTLAKDGNPNAGPTSPRTLTISGQVLGTDYVGKSAGNYSDTVIISINP
jgi:spore coat protein U-like protein